MAKALEDDVTAGDISSSPTISRLATQAGIILGTAAYMSPEQAKGKLVDRRTDIWAFGCVLYEMLTGEPAFGGETVTDVLVAVVRAEPDWSQLPAGTSNRVRELLRRCLTKDAKQRLQAIGEARIALDEAQDAGELPGHTPVPPFRPWRGMLPWAAAIVLPLIAAISTYIAGSPSPPQTIVSEISAPQNTNFVFRGNLGGPPVLSPDGQRLAFVASGSDRQQRLWVRLLSTATAQPLEGTEGAAFPFWSPDSRSLGFFANGNLNRIDVAGGPAIAIAEAPQGRGGAWGADSTILYPPGFTNPLYRVAASGGTPQQVTKLDNARMETTHR